MPTVNHAILKWAREKAGLSEDEAVAKLKIKPAYGKDPVDRLRALESGQKSPSRPLLVKMAKQYHQPLLVFYLAEPPKQGNRGQDFRTLPEDGAASDEALLDALIRDVVARHDLIRSALIDDDETEALSFVGSAAATDGVSSLALSLERLLGFSILAYRKTSNVDAAFSYLRDLVEARGVIVMLLGNLGSHHTAIGVDTFRGFALADDIAPFVVINDQDSHAAWSFTLVHEMVHLLLGLTGVSGGRPQSKVEKLCNDVASEVLLPTEELADLRRVEVLDTDGAITLISEFAAPRKISHSMVAYKLYRNQLVSREKWLELSGFFRTRWLAEQKRKRKAARGSDGGPTYYVVRKHRLGQRLIELTARLMNSGSLTTTKAGAVLGVKPQNVHGIVGDSQAVAV